MSRAVDRPLRPRRKPTAVTTGSGCCFPGCHLLTAGIYCRAHRVWLDYLEDR